MGVELLEIGVKVRNGVILIVRGCYRSVCNHPFLVGMLCFLIFLYRLSPFLFQLLVSASPILVCTAVLLGTLLSFGQPNLPEIEVEDKTTHEGASIKAGVSVETAVVEKSESYYVERFSEKGWEEAEKSTDLSVGKLGEVLREDSDDTAPLIEEKSLETDGGIGEGNRKLRDLGYEQKSDWIEERLNNGEIVENHYASAGKVDDELVESDDEKSEADSFDSEKVNVDSLDSPPPSPWTRVEQRKDEEEKDEEEDGSDSGSDRAESSSPDASMADIMPMLDELHPLLDEEAPQTVHIAHDGSDAASEKSQKSSTSGHESDDESENHGDLEVADDDNEDEEDGQGDREELTKSAITWTEEDEKNLMDLGSSEIERNQRLENLILRRARKMLADRNLIDLEGSDLPFDIVPISTRRRNPFDLPNDYYDDSGLPPIPASAPSVLLQRQNPFDIPYDSSEEKPDLMRDGFQEEFRTSQSREPVFRRHESFNVGPSNFAPNRKGVKMRPYFVPEGSFSEESSSSLFRRQSSELSESKLSSVPDTESVSSVTSIEDQERRKFVEEDNLLEAEVVAQMQEVEGPSGDSGLISQHAEEDGHQEPETNAKMECVFEHVGHGSQSSEEDDSLELGQVEKRDVEVGELESRVEDVIDHDDRRYPRDSSSSSLSEGSERVFTVTEGEGLSMLDEIRHDVAQEPGISAQTSVQSTDLNIASTLVDDISHSEPVYDSSPRELSKNVSSSSISSDLGSVHFIDKRTVSSIEREFEGGSQEIVTAIPDNIEMLPDTSVAQSIDEFRPIDAVDIREHDNVETDFSGVDQKSISEGSSTYARITLHMSIPLKSSDEALESFEDRDLEQEKYSLPSGRESIAEVSELLFEDQLSRHSVGMEEVVQSPNANAELSHEADEKLISTPLSGGNTTVFHDKAINEPNLEHMNEAQASSTPVESFVDTQKLNMTEDQNLDHHISSNISSLSTPEYVNIPPTAIETATPCVDVQRMVEEVDEIKEIDDRLLSELDNVGDFSVNQLGSDSTESEKHVDSVGEENLPSHHAETSTMRGVEVPSVEVNKIEDAFLSENSREHIDISEEDVDRISELQTSETRRADNIEASRVEFNENDGKDSLLSHDYEDTVSTIPEVEVRSFEDVDAVPLEQAELTSTGTEIIGEEAKLPDQSQVDTDTASVMPELEASTIEDIDLAFKQISSEEIKKPKVLEAILISEETVSAKPETEVQSTVGVDVPLEKAESSSMETETMVGGGDETSQGQVDTSIPCGMTEFEASKIEDIDLAFKHVSSKEIEEPVALEPSESHLYSYEDNISVIRESEARSVGGFDADPEIAEFASAETQIKANTDANSELTETELEASTIEYIGPAFKQVTSMDIENPVVLESPQAELAVGELHKDSSVMSTHETTVSTGPVEDGTLNDKQLADCIKGSDRLHDSADQTLHVVESGETQRDSSELHVAKQIPPESTLLPPHQVLDGETVEQLQPNEDDGSFEVEAHKVGPSERFSVKEAVEKPKHEAEVPEASHSTSSVKGRGKFSKSSSSSSCSSSESSSSDSDEE